MSEHNINNFKSLIKQKRVVKKVPKGALLAMGVPNKDSVSEYSPAGILMGDLLKEVGVSLPPVSTKDTAIMDNVAFVTPSGDNSTGTIGDMNKPYKTVAAVVQEDDRVKYIILLPGNYSESIKLKANTTYYCYPGVNFTFGGISTTDGVSFSNARWLGYAKFTGTSSIKLTQNAFVETGVYIEFDSIHHTDSTASPIGFYLYKGDEPTHSQVEMRFNSFYAVGGNGAGVDCRGHCDITLKIKYSMLCNYGNFRGVIHQAGRIELHCPKIVLLDDGHIGQTPNYKVCVSQQACGVDSHMVIYGDMYSEMAATTGSISGMLVAHNTSGTITHYGNIHANLTRPIYNDSDIELRQIGGHVYGSETSVLSKGSLTFMDGHINDIRLSGTSKLYMKNATVEGTLDLSTTTEEVVILDTTIKSTGTNSITADTPKTNVTMQNVLSNKPLNNITNTLAAGFTEDAGLDNIDISKF